MFTFDVCVFIYIYVVFGYLMSGFTIFLYGLGFTCGSKEVLEVFYGDRGSDETQNLRKKSGLEPCTYSNQINPLIHCLQNSGFRSRWVNHSVDDPLLPATSSVSRHGIPVRCRLVRRPGPESLFGSRLDRIPTDCHSESDVIP